MTRLRRSLRAVLAAAGACALAVPAAAPHDAVAANPASASQRGYAWARTDMSSLARAGVWRLPDSLARTATRGDLTLAVQALDDTPFAADNAAAGGANAGTAAPVTARTASVAVLNALGLQAEMRGLNQIHTADGRRLKVPAGFGAAVLSRELGLRYNYPAADDALEHTDAEPMTVADLVRMIAKARSVDSWRVQALADYRTITLPTMSAAQRTVVEAALAQTGMPYVWGGDWPTTASPWGGQAHGGFDCSGLVWMAYKGAASSAAIGAGADLGGRTADQMAWERPAQRIPVAAAKPGDLIFFGAKGLKTPRGGVEHVGIALGNGWLVHSSGSRAGTSISKLATYWPAGIAGARRPAVLGAPSTAPAPVTPTAPDTATPNTPNSTTPATTVPVPSPAAPSTGYPASPATSGPTIPF